MRYLSRSVESEHVWTAFTAKTLKTDAFPTCLLLHTAVTRPLERCRPFHCSYLYSGANHVNQSRWEGFPWLNAWQEREDPLLIDRMFCCLRTLLPLEHERAKGACHLVGSSSCIADSIAPALGERIARLLAHHWTLTTLPILVGKPAAMPGGCRAGGVDMCRVMTRGAMAHRRCYLI